MFYDVSLFEMCDKLKFRLLCKLCKISYFLLSFDPSVTYMRPLHTPSVMVKC